MVCTSSHDLSIADSDFVKNHLVWDKWVTQEMTVWRDFHEFWLHAKVPVHILRYEDLCKNQEKALPELFKFLFNTESLKGTLIEKLIEKHIGEKAVEIYKPRKGLVNGNKDKFTKQMLEFCRENFST